MSFHVVIPARRHSQRLPDKALLDIGGKPMIVRVMEQAALSSALSVTVATDDEDIATAVTTAGGQAEMTLASHQSGTDRIAEVAAKRQWDADAIVVNVQGDEPLIPPALIDQVARLLSENPLANMATLAAVFSSQEDPADPNVVKVVKRDDGRALYFSRALIPYHRDSKGMAPQRHVGIYAYRVDALRRMVATSVAELEATEKLEQLRALSIGLEIMVATAVEEPGVGVDTQQDLDTVRALVADRVP